MSNVIDFSKEEMLEELLDVLIDYAEQLHRLFGSKSNIEVFGNSVSINTSPDMQKIRLDYRQSQTFSWMSRAYDYAVHGIMDEIIDWDWEVMTEDYFAFIEDLMHSKFFEYNNVYGKKPKMSMKIVKLAEARNMIDLRVGNIESNDSEEFQNGYTKISHIAILAGLDERTIRNLTNPKNKNHLKTEKHGNSTFVSIDVALEWLEKRGFKKTIFKKANTHRELDRHGFRNIADLAEFLEDVSEYRHIPKNSNGHYTFNSDAVSAYMLEISKLRTCTKDEQNSNKPIEREFRFDFNLLEEIAGELSVNKIHFLDSCFKLHQDMEKNEVMKKLAALQTDRRAK